MRRGLFLVCILVWALSAVGGRAWGEVLRVEGEVLGVEMFLFDQVEGPLLAYPFDRGPVPYVGQFSYEPEAGLALFEVSIDSCLAAGLCMQQVDLESGMWQEVRNPTKFRLERNVFAGVVRNDSAALVIDYTSPRRPEEWVTSFDLWLDKRTGQGEWRWSYAPPLLCVGDICAPSVSGASAFGTITSYGVVPEPGSAALVAAMASLCFTRRRHTECACYGSRNCKLQNEKCRLQNGNRDEAFSL